MAMAAHIIILCDDSQSKKRRMQHIVPKMYIRSDSLYKYLCQEYSINGRNESQGL